MKGSASLDTTFAYLATTCTNNNDVHPTPFFLMHLHHTLLSVPREKIRIEKGLLREPIKKKSQIRREILPGPSSSMHQTTQHHKPKRKKANLPLALEQDLLRFFPEGIPNANIPIESPFFPRPLRFSRPDCPAFHTI